METTLFAPISQLFAGLATGIGFGYLLRKGYVTRFSVIVGQLLLRDFTVLKVMLTAIALGSLGIFLATTLSPELALALAPTPAFAALIGGGIFGIGMATMGFCPGTGIAALADGARDMWFGVLGMIVGAGLYAHFYPVIAPLFGWDALGEVETLPRWFGISPLAIVVPLLVIIAGLVVWDVYSKQKAQ